MSGIGAVITKNVPSHALVYGNPAKVMGWVDEKGQKLIRKDEKIWTSVEGVEYVETDTSGLKRKI
jgi:UDP-2-acetamido-3-amino-2,3-dideoxy-glucuronate N-acetyltransferase